MGEYIEPSVRGLLDSTGTETVTLLVGCDADRDQVAADINELDAEVLKKVGRTTLRVDVVERDIDAVWNHQNVISVELDADDVKRQDEGNSKRLDTLMT